MAIREINADRARQAKEAIKAKRASLAKHKAQSLSNGASNGEAASPKRPSKRAMSARLSGMSPVRSWLALGLALGLGFGFGFGFGLGLA